MPKSPTPECRTCVRTLDQRPEGQLCAPPARACQAPRVLPLLAAACRALLGQEWHSLGDPCVGGASPRRTFLAQATFALPVPGLPGRFLLMADVWDPECLGLSRRARRAGQARIVALTQRLFSCLGLVI